MRITNNLLIHNMLWNMNNNLTSMNIYQTQLSTGKRIHKPSDDPVGTTKIIKLKTDIVENQQYKNNVRDAKAWLDMSENSLMDLKKVLQRMRELSVQAANDSNTEEDTGKIAKEIDELKKEIITLANSSMAGRYLFSGFNTDKKMLNPDGTFNIDITAEKLEAFKAIAYEIGVGEEIPVGVDFLKVFGAVMEDNAMTKTFKFGPPRYQEVKGAAATHSKLQGKFNLKSNLASATGDVTVTVNGVTYKLDKSKLDGNQTQEELTSVLKNAEQISPTPAGTPKKLGEAVEVFFVEGTGGSSGADLVLESKTFGPVTMTMNANMTGGYTAPPTFTNGQAATDAVLNGTETITDSDVKPGQQSFVVTYKGKTERIDVTVAAGDKVADLVAKVNAQLKTTFGDDGGSPAKNNVAMTATHGGTVKFTGASKDDGSRASLKVDVIMSKKPQLIQDVEDFSKALNSKDNDGIQGFLSKIDKHLDNNIAMLADVGARNNRLTFIENRIDDNNLAMTKQLSQVQDINYAEVTIKFKSLESIYRASLSVGARTIQPTLVDFIR